MTSSEPQRSIDTGGFRRRATFVGLGSAEAPWTVLKLSGLRRPPGWARVACGMDDFSSASQITALLELARRGDSSARDRLLTSIYDELRELARAYLSDRRTPGHTLQATALVNEVCLRLLRRDAIPGENRVQFRAFVAKAMRNLLIDHARERNRLKRGGSAGRRVPLDEELIVNEEPTIDFLALDESLERLAAIGPRKARVVELRYFGGMSVEDVATALNTSPATVKREWSVAKTWLFNDLNGGRSGVD